jgi:hypothetical protein
MVDGAAVLDIDDLYARLGEARKNGRRVTFTFKKLAGSDSMFAYTQRNLPIGDLRIIGPQPAAQ